MALHHSEGDMLEAGHDAVVNAASVAGRGLAFDDPVAIPA